MKKNNWKICVLELLLLAILFFALFAPNIITRSYLAIILFGYMFFTCYFLKKRKIVSIYKKNVDILMLIFSGIYLVVFYAMGLYFGFQKSKIILSWWSFTNYILPLAIIIFSSEMIRRVLLSQKIVWTIRSKQFNILLVLTYISMVLIDLVVYTNVYSLSNLNNFLTALGFVLFASLSCNLLYNYITCRYGCKGIIIYRLITVLFIYFIPVTPDVYIFFRSFFRMLYPYLIYIILERLYSKNDFSLAYYDKRKIIIGNTILIIIMTLLIMLISCQFKYGILVIGSRSMSGTLNVGDAVIYENYTNQTIKEGHIIIFNYNNVSTIHRVVEIKNVNGEYRYYTKGDANKKIDDNYSTIDDITGIVRLRVKYVGYPTLMVRNMFL